MIWDDELSEMITPRMWPYSLFQAIRNYIFTQMIPNQYIQNEHLYIEKRRKLTVIQFEFLMSVTL